MGDEVVEMKKIGLKRHFVLVHGMGGGGWCWYKIKCLMENSGHKVSCIDLKSGGIDQSDANKILSFEEYNEPLMDFMSALPHNELVILVGHSVGGLSVTGAIHKFAKKISLAIYIAANMLKTGFTTDQDFKDAVPNLSEFGDVFDFDFGMGLDRPPTSAIIRKEFQRDIIYHMSPQEDSTLAAMLLRAGPLWAIRHIEFAEGPNADNVARVYIKTMNDRVIKPEQQDAMIKKWLPLDVYILESDHSPFFSAPFLLYSLLVKAVTNFHSM